MKSCFSGDAESCRRTSVLACGVGFAFLLLGSFVGFLAEVRLAPAYLSAWLFWIQLSGGALALMLIWGVGGGRWGTLFAAEIAACRWTWGTVCILVLPMALWGRNLYGLTDDEWHSWIGRSMVALGALAILAWRAGKRPYERWRWSGPGLVVVGLAFSLMAVDWTMALTSHFHSTIFPFIWFADSLVGALAWLAVTRGGGDSEGSEAGRYQFGKLLFASVFFWGYIAISQWIIVWSADLPHEARWYLDRSQDGWMWGTVFVALVRFAVPFSWLLSAGAKRSPARSRAIGMWLLGSQFLTSAWMVLPSVGGGVWELLLAFVLTLGIGGLWICGWLYGRATIGRRERSRS